MFSADHLRLSHTDYRQTGRACTIDFNGKSIPAIEGDTILAALTAASIKTFGDDRGRQRSAFCGMGSCMECLVVVDGSPGHRACLTKIRDGQVIRTGTSLVTSQPNKAQQEVADVVVVGAGPAGLVTARDLAMHGLVVVVLDERPSSGGQFFKPLSPGFAFLHDRSIDRQFSDGKTLVDATLAAGVQIRNQTTVWDIEAEGDGFVLYSDALNVATRWTARRVVLATGATERPLPVSGWTLPGVMATGAAQTLSRSYRVAPGQRILIAGNGPLNLQLAAGLAADGASVVAVAEAAQPPYMASFSALRRLAMAGPTQTIQGIGYLATLRRHGTSVHFNTVLTAIEGDQHVEAAVLTQVDKAGRPVPASERRVSVDTVCMGYGFQPNLDLLQILGAAMRPDQRQHYSGNEIPVIDATGRTSVPGLFVTGDCSGIWGAAVAQTSGALVAERILSDLRPPVARSARAIKLEHRLERERLFQTALWDIFRAPPGLRRAASDAVLCRCENIKTADILATLARQGDCQSIADVKRATRCGMGRCQGRLCSENLSDHIGPGFVRERLSSQAPAKPLTVANLRSLECFAGDTTTVAAIPAAPVLSPTAEAPLNLASDVAIIGGGVIGLCTALSMAERGADVILIDRSIARGSASFANAGSLHAQILAYAFPVLEGEGVEAAVNLLRMQKHSIRLWQALASRLDTDIEMSITGGLVVAETPDQVSKLKQKVALENAAGGEIALMSGNEARHMVPMLSEHVMAASYAADEGKLNPLLAAPALARLARSRGVRILEQAPVLAIARDTNSFQIETARGTIRAARVVNAAGGLSGEVASLIGEDIPVRATPLHMLVTEATPALSTMLIAHVSDRLTMKQAAAGNIIIGGGWRAVATQGGALRASGPRIAGNLAVAARILPAISGLLVLRSWVAVNSGTDGRPLLRESARTPGFFHAVTMNGMTLGPAFGEACADMVLGHPTAQP